MMKICHVVLLKQRPEVPRERIQAFLQACADLRGKIPGMIRLSAGAQDSGIYPGYVARDRGFSHAIVVDLESPSALEEYSGHELHRELVQKHIAPNFQMEHTIALDFQS